MVKNGDKVFKKAEAQMKEAYASVKRIKGVSYRSSRLSSDNLSSDSSYKVNRNASDNNIFGEKYYVIFREDFDVILNQHLNQNFHLI